MLWDKILEKFDEERDMGVIISTDLKVLKQCRKVENTANIIVIMITWTFTCKSSDILLPLYKSLVRPYLEYCVQALQPCLEMTLIYYRNFKQG